MRIDLEARKRTRFFLKRTLDNKRQDLFCGLYQLVMFADGHMWLNYFGDGRQLSSEECSRVQAAVALMDSDPQIAREQLTPVFDQIMFGEE